MKLLELLETELSDVIVVEFATLTVNSIVPVAFVVAVGQLYTHVDAATDSPGVPEFVENSIVPPSRIPPEKLCRTDCAPWVVLERLARFSGWKPTEASYETIAFIVP